MRPVKLPRLRCALLGLLPLRARGGESRAAVGEMQILAADRRVPECAVEQVERVNAGNINRKIIINSSL